MSEALRQVCREFPVARRHGRRTRPHESLRISWMLVVSGDVSGMDRITEVPLPGPAADVQPAPHCTRALLQALESEGLGFVEHLWGPCLGRYRRLPRVRYAFFVGELDVHFAWSGRVWRYWSVLLVLCDRPPTECLQEGCKIGVAAALNAGGNARATLKPAASHWTAATSPCSRIGRAQIHHDALAGANGVLQHVCR